jgi:nucleoside-diphosphate-sugar epimerase
MDGTKGAVNMASSYPGNGELHVVLGASGGVGGAVVRELVARERQVRGVTRSGRAQAPADVEVVTGDVSNLDDARRVCVGAAVVYFCANPPYTRWAADFPPLLEGAIAGASAAGAKLVVADNLYVYAPTPAPLTEDLPWAPTTRKGAVRKRMDETLLAAHQSGKVQVVIGRASDYFGPGGMNSTVGERFFRQLLGGKSVQWTGKLDVPHALAFVTDFGRGLVLLGEHDEALGQAWHVPHAEALTARKFISLAAAVAGVPPKMAGVSPLMLRTLGVFSPVIREVAEMSYEFEGPYLVDGSKFTRAFGFTPTPHRQALTETIAWYRTYMRKAR